MKPGMLALAGICGMLLAVFSGCHGSGSCSGGNCAVLSETYAAPATYANQTDPAYPSPGFGSGSR